MLAVAAAFVAYGIPSAPPEISPVIEAGPSIGDQADVRSEIRALREELAAERQERQELLKELRRERPVPRSPISATRMGAPAIVAPDDEVDDVVSFGDDVLVEGLVRGSATSFGGDVTITSTGIVYGDAVSFGGHVWVEPGGAVHGDRIGLSSSSITATEDFEAPKESWASYLYQRTLLMLSLTGAGILVIGLFPGRVAGVSRQLDTSPITSGLLGAAFSSVMVISALLFMLFTLGLGTPVSAVGLGILAAAWLIGFVAVCQVVGDRLPLRQPNGRWVALIVVASLFTFSGIAGLGGTVLTFMISMVGIGATVASRFGTSS